MLIDFDSSSSRCIHYCKGRKLQVIFRFHSVNSCKTNYNNKLNESLIFYPWFYVASSSLWENTALLLLQCILRTKRNVNYVFFTIYGKKKATTSSQCGNSRYFGTLMKSVIMANHESIFWITETIKDTIFKPYF